MVRRLILKREFNRLSSSEKIKSLAFLCQPAITHVLPSTTQTCLTQATRSKPIPTGLEPIPAQKHGAWKHFRSTPHSICDLSIQKCGCQVWQGCPKDSAPLTKMASGS